MNRDNFDGSTYDAESDLQMLGFRMYDNETGRFTTPDLLWSAFPTQTPYHYAYNSPLTYRDPSGLAPEKEKEREELQWNITEEDLEYLENAYRLLSNHNDARSADRDFMKGAFKTCKQAWNERPKDDKNDGGGDRTGGSNSSAENGQGGNTTDEYLTPSGKIYKNPNGTGKKFVVSDESVEKNTFGNDENGSTIIAFDNLDAYMLPDESTWEKIINKIVLNIRKNNNKEDAAAYSTDEDGNIIYSYGGQGEIDEWGRSNVSEAVKAAIKDVLAMGALDFNLIIVHSHPHPDTGYVQFPSYPKDYEATSNYRGGMMITDKSVFFFGSSRGVFMQFKYSDINDFIRGK